MKVATLQQLQIQMQMIFLFHYYPILLHLIAYLVKEQLQV
jgi:hypothetical protein